MIRIDTSDLRVYERTSPAQPPATGPAKAPRAVEA
jgi:hypothetical protein